MNARVVSTVSLLSILFLSQSAAAAPVYFCSSGPGIDLVSDGCISGDSRGYPDGGDGIYSNSGGGDDEAAVEQAILQATGFAVDVEQYGKSDDDAALFDFTPDTAENKSGSFSVIDNTLIYYITVKAANSFALYELATPSSTGVYSTAGILTPNGNNQPAVGHVSFWTAPISGAEIPEPASMLLLGGGALAALVRRRRGE